MMTTEEKRELLSKPRNEQVDILMKLYKKKFNSYTSAQQECVLSKVRYNNFEYDIYGLLDYLTNGNNDDSSSSEVIMPQEVIMSPEVTMSEEVFDKPLIKKPTTEVSSILNVEPEVVEVVEEKEEKTEDGSKKVSFDLNSSSSDNTSSSSSTTKKITL